MEFKTYKLRETSDMQMLIKYNPINRWIFIREAKEDGYWLMQEFYEDGIRIFDCIQFLEQATILKKEDLILTNEIYEINLPKKYYEYFKRM